MRSIEVVTLGAAGVRAHPGAAPDLLVRRPKPLAVLCHVALESANREHARSTLLAMFWPETDQARAQSALRKTLHVLREALGQDALVSRGRQALALGRRVTCDAVGFAHLYAQGRYAEALSHYHGPFMAGFHLAGCSDFGHWMDGVRTRLAAMALGAAEALRDLQEQGGDLGAALHWAHKAESLAPHNEDAVRRTLQLMARAGDRAGAIRRYDRFAEMIEEDFGLQPEEATWRLVESFRAPRKATAGSSVGPHVTSPLAVLSVRVRPIAGADPDSARAAAKATLEAVMGAARRSARGSDAVVRMGPRTCAVIAPGATRAIGRNLKTRIVAEVARLRATGQIPEGTQVAFKLGTVAKP